MGRSDGRRYRWLIVSALLVGVAGTSILPLVRAEESSRQRSRSTRSSGTSASSGGDAKVEQKLDEILDNQQKLFTRLDQIMEELKIVKIRATLK